MTAKSIADRIRILVVDDHFVVRMGLVASFNLEADMLVVAEASDGQQAIEQYRKHRPDIVVMDLRMPDADGVETTATLCREMPPPRIIIFSSFAGDENVRRALAAGAHAYVVKSAPHSELVAAIRSVHAGKFYLPPALAADLAQHMSRPGLNDDELDVLRLVDAGRSNKEIADALSVSEVTVKRRVGHILQKLGAADRTQAATVAIQRGIILLT
ncbi:MAG: response regulator transcription factor [Verrucomicrobiota bacterium]